MLFNNDGKVRNKLDKYAMGPCWVQNGEMKPVIIRDYLTGFVRMMSAIHTTLCNGSLLINKGGMASRWVTDTKLNQTLKVF
jgi:hypothetical protein